MPFTADELININNAALENYIDTGTVLAQNITNKPFLKAMSDRSGSFSGGNEFLSWTVKSGQGGGALQGYSHDDQVNYYNPTGIKRARVRWYEHHIGLTYTFSELKRDGIEVVESGTTQRTVEISGREKHALANILDDKMETMGEDYAVSLNALLWGDGSGDAKALPGIRSIILANPFAGTTFGLSRSVNTWWRNDACTAAAAGAGGLGAITSSPANGGALIEAMDKAKRRRSKYASGEVTTVYFAGSDFIDAYKLELRANGQYYSEGVSGKGAMDGSMADPKHGGIQLTWDPYMDDNGMAKRCYAIDVSRNGLRLYYLNGKKMNRHNPARPYDRYVVYNGITCTAAMYAKRLNTSGVYDIT